MIVKIVYVYLYMRTHPLIRSQYKALRVQSFETSGDQLCPSYTSICVGIPRSVCAESCRGL